MPEFTLNHISKKAPGVGGIIVVLIYLFSGRPQRERRTHQEDIFQDCPDYFSVFGKMSIDEWIIVLLLDVFNIKSC